MPQSEIVKVATNGLSKREEVALEMHLKAGEPPLSPILSAQLFELYLNGMSLEDIQRRNKGLRLGAIVRAADEGEWYSRRLDYTQSLLEGVRTRVQQSQARSILFVSDAMEMINKRFGDMVLKYLQTGDIADLGELKDWGLYQYKQLADLLIKLTGQGNNKQLGVNVNHAGAVTHQHEGEAVKVSSTAPTPEDAARLLEMLSGLGVPKP